MLDATFDKAATYYRTTHPAVMTCSLLLLSVLFVWAVCSLGDSIELWKIIFACSLLWVGAIFYAVKWVHSVHFTSEGLSFYRFGQIYRKIPWNQIVQVGLAKEYKATKLTIALTPTSCPQFEQKNSTTTSYVERYRNQLILVDATRENIDCILSLYGDFNYDANQIGR